MRTLALPTLFCLAVGYSLAHFFVLLYNNWYFAELFWLKTALLTPLLAALYGFLLFASWRKLWLGLGVWWLASFIVACLSVMSLDLRELGFTAVLNFEAAMIWPTSIIVAAYAMWQSGARLRREAVAARRISTQLELRRRLRRKARSGQAAQAIAAGLLCIASVAFSFAARADEPAPPDTAGASREGADQGFLPGVDDPEPQHLFPNRHSELADPALRLGPEGPPLPGMYPIPAHQRAREVFYIIIENKRDGAISVCREIKPGAGPAGAGLQVSPPEVVGHVLAPVTQVNPKGFTASGWAQPGTICASAVNAIHLKTDHNYNDGRGVIFSLEPVEFAQFDPKAYKSYFNKSSSLFTDIPAGTAIFGGQWAPLVGSVIYLAPDLLHGQYAPLTADYVPRDGDTLAIRVARHKYNPEWIEFENSFGGLIWVKELGLDAYPIGQVLKPVVGIGRFLGTQYAGLGRIRAAHPGVLCISTSPDNLIGGFQIIPRDHAMSPEMTYARVKTQWMVVGPLWALDPSWEGLPPLFTDYFYPAFTPAFNADGTTNEEVTGAAVFLDRFTVRARYSDAEDPQKYILLREADLIDNYALKTMTHLRIFFPRT